MVGVGAGRQGRGLVQLAIDAVPSAHDKRGVAAPDPPESAPESRQGLASLVRLFFVVLVGASVWTVILGAARNFRFDRLYDDAFIFQRYTTRLLSGGGLDKAHAAAGLDARTRRNDAA